MWKVGEVEAGSGTIWKNVDERLGPGESISRTSILFFMNGLVERGVLSFRDGTGKGGPHKIYYPLMDEKEFVSNLVRTMVESMMKEFPEEVKEVLKDYS